MIRVAQFFSYKSGLPAMVLAVMAYIAAFYFGLVAYLADLLTMILVGVAVCFLPMALFACGEMLENAGEKFWANVMAASGFAVILWILHQLGSVAMLRLV